MLHKLLLLACIITPVYADEPAFINLNDGYISVLDKENQSRWGIEYRFASITKYDLIPTIGIVNSARHAKYIYTEVRHNFYISPDWILTPSFGTGLFDNNHDIELGSTLEFRSGLELAYKFDNNYRAGLAIYHLSNGGINSTNPGTESIVLSLSIPIGEFQE
jgi:hypothetical protein